MQRWVGTSPQRAASAWLQPGAAVDNQELWLAQPALDEIAATRRPHESEYFRFELYLNGNLHIVFKRPDLVAKANPPIRSK